MNIDVFTIRQLQDFMALISTLESEKVTDLRFVRQLIQEKITKDTTMIKRNVVQKKQQPNCPDCGKRLKRHKVDNFAYLGCCNCPYSEVA